MPLEQSVLDDLQATLIRNRYRPKTAKSYVACVRQFSDYVQGIPLEDVTFEQIKEYFNFLQYRKRLSRQTRRQAVRAMRFCYLEVLRKEFPFEEIVIGKESKSTKVPLSKEDIHSMLQVASPGVERLVLMLLYSTGMDVTELISLEIGNINFDKGAIRIRTVRNKPRIIPLSQVLAPELKAYIADLHSRRWLFPGQLAGKHICITVAQRILKKLSHKANVIHPVNPKAIRYAYVKHMQALGIPIDEILRGFGVTSGDAIRGFIAVDEPQEFTEINPLDYLARPEVESINLSSIEKQLHRLTEESEREYLTEALQCIRYGLLRAAVIMAWQAAYANICSKLLTLPQSEINSAIQKHYPKAHVIGCIDDFSHVKERTVLEASVDVHLYDSNEKEQLVECLNLRNKCGHHGKYRPQSLRVSAFIEDLVSIVFAPKRKI